LSINKRPSPWRRNAIARSSKNTPKTATPQDRPPAEESWRDPDRPRGIPGLRPGEPSVANPDDTHELLDWSLAYSALPPNEGTLPHSQPVEVDADVLA
jgi:hypothetical protein